MNVAQWTLSPLLERQAAERRKAQKRLKWRFLAFWLAIFSLFPLTLVATQIGLLFLVLIPIYAIGFVWLGITGLAHFKKHHIASINWAEAAESELGAHIGWPIELLILQEGTPTGIDRGMLWVEEDRLYFAGNRTSFGLTADQAAAFCRIQVAIPELRHDIELRVATSLKHDLTLSFRPIVTKGLGSSAISEICREVNRWIGRGSTKNGQLPPLEIGPGIPSAARLLLRAAASSLYWIFVTAGFFFLTLTGAALVGVPMALLGIGIGVIWSVVWSPWLRIKALLSRYRLNVHGTRRFGTDPDVHR